MDFGHGLPEQLRALLDRSNRGMAMHDAFRMAGGPGGIGNDHEIVGIDRRRARGERGIADRVTRLQECLPGVGVVKAPFAEHHQAFQIRVVLNAEREIGVLAHRRHGIHEHALIVNRARTIERDEGRTA